MCAHKQFCLSLALLCLFAGALQAEPLYRISEAELASIETYLSQSEREKQSWLLQASALRAQAMNLNAQLQQARNANRKLEQSFNAYESESLGRLAMRETEIAELHQKLAAQALLTEKHRGNAKSRLVVIFALSAAWGVFGAVKVYRLFR